MRNLFGKMLDKVRQAISDDGARRKILFTFVSLALSLTSFVMTIVNVFTAEYILMTATFIYSVLSLLNAVLMSKTKLAPIVVFYIFAVETIALLTFFLVSGIPDGFSVLWISQVLSFSLLVFGIKLGTAFSGIIFAIVLFFFGTPVGRSLLQYNYNDVFELRFPFFILATYLLSLLIEFVRIETQKKLTEAKAEYNHLYRHDALTELYNRYGIGECIKELIQAKITTISAVLFDIDDFKIVNDTYGHDCGDEVLRTVARILIETDNSQCCRYCRWGGEEFLIILPNVTDGSEFAENIRRKIADTKTVYNGKSVSISASFGVCNGNNIDAKNIQNLINRADDAMYKSKDNGKNRLTTFTFEN